MEDTHLYRHEPHMMPLSSPSYFHLTQGIIAARAVVKTSISKWISFAAN